MVTSSGAGREQPAKLLLERRAPPSERAALEHATRQLLASAQRTGALEGSSVLSVGDDVVVIMRFQDRGALERWQSQEDVVALQRAWHGTGADGAERLVRTGLETWFALPGDTRQTPAKWKMALVTWSALLPHVLLLGVLLPSDLPYPLGPALGTALPVASLTWLVMPRLSALLAPWLYPQRRARPLAHTPEVAP